MSLFANSPFRPPTSQQHLPARIPGLGYILFPSPSTYPDSLPSIHDAIESPLSSPNNEESLEGDVDDETRGRAEKDHLDSPARRRRELEAEEARKGEEDWVRSGGVLRDAEGRRDRARTQAIREELELRELEKQILDRWDRYEEGWRNLLSRVKRESGSLKFEDIPWPVKGNPVRVGDVTVKGVEEFLLEVLTVRGVRITKKDRVRSSLLRWHPDKLGKILGQIHSEHTENVRQGIGIVMECLHRLNAQS